MSVKMIKILSLMLALSMLCAAFASCKTNEETSETEVASSETETTVSETETTESETETTVSETETTVSETETTVSEIETTVSEIETTESETAESESVTERIDETVVLEGDHAELIAHADGLKNKVNAYYSDGDKSSFVIENKNTVLSYSIKAGKPKQIGILANKAGGAYLDNTSDVYIKMSDGKTYLASASTASVYPNFYQHGFYYYEVGLEGQNFYAEYKEQATLTIDHTDIAYVNDLTYTKSGSLLSCVVTGISDAYIGLKNISFSADDYNALAITMKADGRVDPLGEIFVKAGNYETLNAQMKCGFEVIGDGEYHTYYVFLDELDGYFGQVTDMRLDIGGEIGCEYEIKELRAVKLDRESVPRAAMNRVFNVFSDRLYEQIQISAYKTVTGVDEIGIVTRIDADTVEKLIIADKNGEHYGIDGVDMESVTFVGFLIKDAGVFGYISPLGEYEGKMDVTLSGGEYIITRYSSPENGTLIPPTIETGNGDDFYMGHRIYTDMTSDFKEFLKTVKEEREPLGEENFTVVGKNGDNAKFLGYDALSGTYRFSVAGIQGFNAPYYTMPNKHIEASFRVVSDTDRDIYIEIMNGSGQLESAVLLDKAQMLLPVPMEVCKNFALEEDPTLFDKQDAAYGNVYFPLTLKGGEEQEYTVASLYQNWGRYALKQLSSIAFYNPYYHLSLGMTETNCITMHKLYRLPDFRSMSAPLWETQPQHSRGGNHVFLSYTDEQGSVVGEIHKKNTILSYGPTYASVKMEFVSSDGRIKSTYTHTEMPQDDENRTFYTLRYEVLEDISFNDLMSEFSIYSMECLGGRYSYLTYLDESNNVERVKLKVADGKNEIYRLGDEYPYFALYKMVDYTGSPTDIGPDNYVNLACLITSRNITVGGEKCEAPFVIVEDGGHVSLSLELGETTLRAGDLFELEMILLPWGSQESGSDRNVRIVRENTLLTPITVSADENCVVKGGVIPTVKSEDGKSASFTVSGGKGPISNSEADGINLTLRVEGIHKLTAPVIYEKIDGEWQIYEVSSAKIPDKSGNAYAYDGYGVEYAGNGTFTYSFVITVTGEDRSFKLVADENFTEWPEVVVSPEMMGDKLNVYLDPNELYEAAAGGNNMGEIILSEDESFVTFKSLSGVEESFFTAYTFSAFYESGSYFVIKYRAPKAMANIEVFTSTENIVPTAGDSFYINASDGMLICDGEWQVAVVDLSKAVGSFNETEESGYGAKYIRLDIINGAYSEERTIDVAFVGISTSLDEILKLCDGVEKIPVLDGNRVYDLRDSDAVPEDPVPEDPDPMAIFVDPAELYELSRTLNAKGFGSVVLDEGGEFTRFFGDGASPEAFIVSYNDSGKVTGKYAVIKYRIPTTNAEALGIFEIFTSDTNPTPSGGDNFRVPVKQDGEWHTMVIDLSIIATEGGAPAASGDDYTAKYIRFDLFNAPVGVESYIDVAFIGLAESLEDIAAVDESYDLYGN